jgi:hypothetical protein
MPPIPNSVPNFRLSKVVTSLGSYFVASFRYLVLFYLFIIIIEGMKYLEKF